LPRLDRGCVIFVTRREEGRGHAVTLSTLADAPTTGDGTALDE
jgi:hypothetical protein